MEITYNSREAEQKMSETKSLIRKELGDSYKSAVAEAEACPICHSKKITRKMGAGRIDDDAFAIDAYYIECTCEDCKSKFKTSPIYTCGVNNSSNIVYKDNKYVNKAPTGILGLIATLVFVALACVTFFYIPQTLQALEMSNRLSACSSIISIFFVVVSIFLGARSWATLDDWRYYQRIVDEYNERETNHPTHFYSVQKNANLVSALNEFDYGRRVDLAIEEK